MKKSQILRAVSDEFAKKYNCRAYTTSNFSIMNAFVYPLLSHNFIYEFGYFVKLKHSLSNREIVANITFQNSSCDNRQKVYVGLKHDNDTPVIDNAQKSCGKGLDIIVQK